MDTDSFAACEAGAAYQQNLVVAADETGFVSWEGLVDSFDT